MIKAVMPVQIRIPAALRNATDGQAVITVTPGTVKSALAELRQRFPSLQERLLNVSGDIHPFVNLYVNEEDIRFLKGVQTPVRDGDEVVIIAAIAGG